MSEQPAESSENATAGFFSRTIAFMLDLFLLVFLELMSGLVFFIILQFFHYQKIINFVASLLGIENYALQLLGLVSPLLFLVSMVYFVFFWSFIGFTPGKALLGLQIVRQNGQRLSVGRAIVRFIGYMISAIPLFLGFIWIIFDREHEGWHDKLANTQVRYRL